MKTQVNPFKFVVEFVVDLRVTVIVVDVESFDSHCPLNAAPVCSALI